jgi:hypothetical protein
MPKTRQERHQAVRAAGQGLACPGGSHTAGGKAFPTGSKVPCGLGLADSAKNVVDRAPPAYSSGLLGWAAG